MNRFYILPVVEVQEENPPRMMRKAKYLHEMDTPSGGMRDYGLIDAAVAAADVTQEQHESLVANLDVVSPPEDLDQNVSDIAIPKIKAVMEQLRIPAGWVDTTFTYRQVLRMIVGLFQFAQRHWGLHGEVLIDNAGQLDLRWNQIPQERRERILATADALGYEYDEVENSWLVRRIFKYLGDQWGEKPFKIGGNEL